MEGERRQFSSRRPELRKPAVEEAGQSRIAAAGVEEAAAGVGGGGNRRRRRRRWLSVSGTSEPRKGGNEPGAG
jgi:hypothetical protein